VNTFMAIMSQLFWGVTVGALTATFSWIGKAVAVAACVPAAIWAVRRHRRRKLPRKP
jgi:hypothetical protein